MKMSVEFAEKTAREIGEAIASDGRAAVSPWCRAFTWWSDVERVLGVEKAMSMAQEAFYQEQSRRIYGEDTE